MACHLPFVSRIIAAIAENTDEALGEALEFFLEEEARVGHLFRVNAKHPRLFDPFVGLINIFEAPTELRRIHAPQRGGSVSSIMPVEALARKTNGDQSIVPAIDQFRKNFEIFTEGRFAQVTDWNNLAVAGEAVQACLTPLPEDVRLRATRIRHFFHKEMYRTSDVQVFIWGLSPDQAFNKIISLCRALGKSLPFQTTRYSYNPNNLSLAVRGFYPYRTVQVSLCLFKSPADILSSFDIDCTACLYTGHEVYMSPRAVIAAMRQANTIDMSRRSSEYELRLAEYGARHFEIRVPTLDREAINPDVYEMHLTEAQGLARLLILERMHATGSDVSALGRESGHFSPPYLTRLPFNEETEDLESLLGRIPHGLLVKVNTYETSRDDWEALNGWSHGVYSSTSSRLMWAIANHRRDRVLHLLSKEDVDINQCEQGITPLLLAILVKAEDIAFDLIDRGAKISQRLSNGLNALHLAARLNMPGVIRKLVTQSKLNTDVWTQNQQGCPLNVQVADDTVAGDVHADRTDMAEGDILGVDIPDRGTGYTALCYALIYGSEESVCALAEADANAGFVDSGPSTPLRHLILQRSASYIDPEITEAFEHGRLIANVETGRAYFLP